MATTNPILAGRVLDALVAASVPFVVLHGESRIAMAMPLSDVDVAVDISPEQLIIAAIPEWAAVDLHPVQVCPYDVGGTSVFLATSDASDGVQLDLLHDPDGYGRLGVRTSRLVDRAYDGCKWPRLPRREEATYLLAKRLLKGQQQAAMKLRAELLEAGGPADILSSARRNFSRRGGRIAKRVIDPVGFWLDTRASTAGPVAERFARFLTNAVVVNADAGFFQLIPHLLRPELVVSSGRRRGPHLHLDIDDPDVVARATVRAMTSRIRQRAAGPR